MGMFSFYNMRKPRQYDHKPIYYDARKEALENRIHKVKMEMGVVEADNEKYKEAIRGSFIEQSSHLKKNRDRGDDIRKRGNRSMRLVFILVLLGLVFWFFYLR